jgi:hypothetical protein
MNSIKEHHDYNRSEGNDIGENSQEDKDELAGPICTCGRMSSSDMMMTVAIDNEKSKPVNGGGVSIKTDQTPDNSNGSGKKTNTVWLESSFVHLMTPRNNIRTTKDYEENLHHQSSAAPSQNEHQSQHGFLERHQHMLKLLEAAYTHIDDVEHSNNFDCKKNNITNDDHSTAVELCVDCIDRVASALEAETQRLYAEVEIYSETVQASKQRSKALQRTTKHVRSVGIAANSPLQHATTTGQTNSSNKDDKVINNNTIEEAYQEEIAMLESEIQARSDELLHYKSIQKEQTELTSELGKLEEGLQLEENSLELQSEAFDNRRQVLTKTLSEVQNEVDKLTCVSLPRVLFDLQVDQARGLHYPLINQLRLAFRPKGDVPAQEIQVAWSQATQLLLILGTLLEYPGLDWKLVPLADCAKLIYRKEIFNLVPGDCRSLMAWNALLDQVVKHALSLVAGGCGNTGNRLNPTSIPRNKHSQYDNRMNPKSRNNTSTRTSDPTTLLKPTLPPYSSSPTMIGNTELARLDPIDHVVWSQVIHRMASNLLWLSNRASSLSATQVSSLVHCVV